MNTLKTALIGTMASLTSVGLSAQTGNDTIRISVDGTEMVITIDDIRKLESTDIGGMLQEFFTGMSEAMSEFQKTNADIEEQLNKGNITQEEADAEYKIAEERLNMKVDSLGLRIEQMAEDIETREEIMEEWEDAGEDHAEHWEEWAEKWSSHDDSSDTHVIIDEDGVRIESGKKRNREPEYEKSSMLVDFHFGLNNLMDQNSSFASGDAEVHQWKSWTFEWGLGQKVRLGSKSPLFIRYGLTFTHLNFETKESLMKYDDPSLGLSVNWQPRTDVNAHENEFNLTYLNIPVSFQLDFSGPDMDEGFNLAVGGYGGVRIGAHRETHYNDFNGDETEEVIREAFQTHLWRYGLMAQIGYGAFKITAKYDLNPLFRSNINAPVYNVGTVTMGFSF